MANETNNNISLLNLPNSIDNAVKNLTDEPTKSIGKTFSDIWYLVFGRYSYKADKKHLQNSYNLQDYENELKDKFNHIPPENRIEPSLQVTAQALENSKYCITSKELRSLFVNLISGSMDSYYEPYVHPSFAEIIKQMTPIDAQLLREFPTKKSATAPTVDYIILNTCTNTFQTEIYNVIFPRLTNCDMFQVSKSVSSLSRLGLITIDREHLDSNDGVYDFFFQTEYYEKQSPLIKCRFPNHQLDIQKYVSYLTPLGRDFVSVCMHP